MYPSFAAPYHPLQTDNMLYFTTEVRILTCGEVCDFEDGFKRVNCENRSLNFIPTSKGCEGAVTLELWGNKIDRLSPLHLLGYENVKTLELRGNEIVSIQSGTFSSMNNLRYVIISNNNISEFENYLFSGTEESLQRIYLNNNKIDLIGKNSFRGLIKVKAVYLNHNQITYLPMHMFRDMRNLRKLHLGSNSIEYLPKTVFNGLSSLEILTLDNNNLRLIPTKLFAGLESLREVGLSFNQLITIHAPDVLGILATLERLDLRNNSLSQISDVFPYFEVSNHLYLHGNPFECSCVFIYLLGWFQGVGNQHSNEEQTFLDQFQKGCTWNESSVSFKDFFLMECELNDFNYLKPDTYSTTWTTLNSESRHATSLSTMPSTSPFLVSKSFMSTKNAEAQSDLTSEKKKEMLLIYIAIVPTLFFFLWVAKTAFDFYKMETN